MQQELYKDKGNHPDIANSLNNIGIAYYHLGDKLKAPELFKQCYFMKYKLLGKDHPDTQAVKNNIISLDAEFSGIGEGRTIILDRGIVNNKYKKMF